MNYWFFLFPYTFVWSDDEQILFYNSENKKNVKAPKMDAALDIVRQLQDPLQLYCVELSEKVFSLPEIKTLLQRIRDIEAGDWTEALPGKMKPILLPPIFKVGRDVKWLKEQSLKDSDSDHSLTYLKEITIFINGDCAQHCACCAYAFKQIPFCVKSKKEMSPELIEQTLMQLLGSCMNRIIISGADYFSYSQQEKLCEVLNLFKCPKEIRVHYLNIPLEKNALSLFQSEAVCLHILVSGVIDKQRIVQLAKFIREDELNVKWTFAVTSEDELLCIEEMLKECPLESIEFKPLLTSENQVFISENVYSDEENILQCGLSKREVFAHQAVNTFDFGNLTILSNGDVYANINEPALGNIETDTVSFMLYQELLNGNSWFKVRDAQPCKACIYQWLCPSPSNYERFTGKSNFCSVK